MFKKRINKSLAATIIVLSGFAAFSFAAYQIDWTSFELSFASVFFPTLFLLIIALMAMNVAGHKDFDITSRETDKKVNKAFDGFNRKTKRLQNLTLALGLGLLATYWVVKLWPF